MYDKFGKVPDQHDGNQATTKTATQKKAGPRWLALAQP